MRVGEGLEYLQRKAAAGNSQARAEIDAIVEPRSTFIFEAFLFLSAGRSVGFGGQEPIRISEVLAYCDMQRVPQSMRQRLLACIRAMDREFLEYQRSASQ